ncbi:glycoside hydrolase family 132 protein [Piedraia hortae CBS 480.64]|uniref:Glycoside hydrolase family 132 protein n=1 Tax=Piedraia hortae CBS 480.64 TaxID=1314780 RepID=A0A6A7BU12_9PEZI|nr:glycoside hydrolase family 132 protein [Piedraia hortae CBS 480.64]
MAARPRHHSHQHAHQDVKRDGDMVVVPGPTVVAYILDGRPISEAEVQEGIRNGTLVWAPGGHLEAVHSATASSGASPTASAELSQSATSGTSGLGSSAPYFDSGSDTTAASSSESDSASSESSSAGAAAYSGASGSSVASSLPSATSSPSSSSPSPSDSASSQSESAGSSADSSTDDDDPANVDVEFPDGELDCSHFPSDYGAVAVDWLGLGGWTGIQSPGISSGGGYGNIRTVSSDACSGSDCCSEGKYCSYACPPGYQKSQWPSTQGSTGQSVGGIQCKGGKLRLTNSDLSTKLCMPGASEVEILVENRMSQNVAICRTDYPGTESETVPLNAKAGTTSKLTCPDADKYYVWEGGYTSAQYYVNPAGVDVSDGCQWGSSANPWGNFAPLNLGVGYSRGSAWLSIFQNLPTTTASLDFTIEVIGDGVNGKCKYSNGEYCSGDNYDDCSRITGCTVGLLSLHGLYNQC